ncbi:MAG: hypothetical protein QOI38_1733 [Sphingomonadales bacterium]|jgi:hypothetical protein|nr:hypothetical protein [Sphingomonadales bacterium]
MSGDFETGLWLPRLAEARRGAWSLRILPATSARGYWGRLYRLETMAMLTGPFGGDGAAWMSIVPVEIESQEIGIASACGHTVVMGLGMGWCAANVALNPAVERVTVVEQDPDVVRLIEALGVFAQLPAAARAKIEVVVGDALGWRPDGPVDSLQADIWAKLVEPGKWDEVRRMQDHVGAGSLYFWGQELELWRLACRARGRVPDRLEPGELGALAAAAGLPLVLDDAPDYAERIAEASRWWTPPQPGWWAGGQ